MPKTNINLTIIDGTAQEFTAENLDCDNLVVSTAAALPAGCITNTNLAGSIADTKLSQITTAGKVASSANADLAAATDSATNSALVKRDASGRIAVNGINNYNATATIIGNATTNLTLQGLAILLNPGINNVQLGGNKDIPPPYLLFTPQISTDTTNG